MSAIPGRSAMAQGSDPLVPAGRPWCAAQWSMARGF